MLSRLGYNFFGKAVGETLLIYHAAIACKTKSGRTGGLWHRSVFHHCAIPSDTELYDGDIEQSQPNIPSEVVEEGIRLVEELLRTWSSQQEDGEDIVMSDDEATPEAQLEELKRCVERFRPQIEGNEWLKSLLTSL